MNPYEILGVDRNANDKAIRSAYKRLARKWHPDLFHTEEEIENANTKMKDINEAFEILKSPEKRAAFDAANPVSQNVYEYYAKKETKAKNDKKKKNNSSDLENEKQRQAVIQFLTVEYEHKTEILDMFTELATGAFNNEFSEEEYLEYLTLVLSELENCITTIKEIISVAKQKQIIGLDSVFIQAQEVIEELTRKGSETPKSLKQAHYVEETRILTEKIHNLMNGFYDRVNAVSSFNLLDKTWEFDDDEQLSSSIKQHKEEVNELLSDIQWVQTTAAERSIPIGFIYVPTSRYSYGTKKITLDKCKENAEQCNLVLNLNLQQLREKFWQERCHYRKNSVGQIIFDHTEFNKCKGNFICPPNINIIDSGALYWLEHIDSITIPAHLIRANYGIVLPTKSLKRLIFTFGTHSQIVDVSNITASKITKEGNYICISPSYSRHHTFALVDEKSVYIYDNEKLCKLNDVSDLEELKKVSKFYDSSSWDGYQLQIHTWAQVVKKLPNPYLMQLLPVSVEAVKEWVKIDKTNFENTILLNDNDDLKTRVIRLYIALGALNGSDCHAQAEYLISKLDVSKMYRSRLERYPNEKRANEDPMFSVPKSAVDLVEENVENKEFLPYVFAFFEGYKLFQSEAKKQNVKLSAEFIINTASQYVFHKKVEKSTTFVKQLFDAEKNINVSIADKILRLYNIAQRQLRNGLKKKIIETVDEDKNSSLRYKFLDLESLQSFIAISSYFKCKSLKNRYYGIEAESVFISSNSHAISIIDSENNCVAIAILNLFDNHLFTIDRSELFADIMYCENKSIDVLEAIKRALIDQKSCNDRFTSFSIGMNEAPRTSKYNEWRTVIDNSNVDWLKHIYWDKFEYLFKCRILGDAYKAYRVRFMVEGLGYHFNWPRPWDNPKIRRRKKRGYW